ncbi:hypothetical protein H4S03_003477 [Coemansia sp. S3946]|nr:hypothetical protein H4S03_003477 [Coemansia sp. S3946]
MNFSHLFLYVCLLLALFQSVAAHLPTSASSPTSCGTGHAAPSPVPTTPSILVPIASDSATPATRPAKFLLSGKQSSALLLLAAFSLVARHLLSTLPSHEVVEPAQRAETATSVVVDVAAPVVTEAATSAVTETATYVVVDVAAPVVTEAATSAVTETATYVVVDVAAPVVTEAAIPVPTESTKTDKTATVIPFSIVSMTIHRTTACSPSGRTPAPCTTWIPMHNTRRKNSSTGSVTPATTRPAKSTRVEKSAPLGNRKPTSELIECALHLPSGQMHSQSTEWTTWHNIQRNTSYVAPNSIRTARAILELSRYPESSAEVIECILRTPSGQIPPPHAVLAAWHNSQCRTRSASPAAPSVTPATTCPDTRVASDMEELLALSRDSLTLSEISKCPYWMSLGRVTVRTVTPRERSEAEREAAIRASAARAAAARATAKQAAANSPRRRPKAHHC